MMQGTGEAGTQNTKSTSQAQSDFPTSEQSTASAESATESAATSRAQSGAESTAGSSATTNDTEGSETGSQSPTPTNQSTGDTSSATHSKNGANRDSSPTESEEMQTDNQSTSQGNETNSSGSSSSHNEHETAGDSSNQHPTDDDDDDVDQVKQRHESNRKSDDELETATVVEGGVDHSEVLEEVNSNNQHNTFKTYTEPDEDEGEFDPDREAVRQFVDDFCMVDTDHTQEVKVHKTPVLNAITEWIEINDIDLNKLDPDRNDGHRKGDLKRLLIDLYDVNHSKYTIDGYRTRGFGGMELSEQGEKLLDEDQE